MACRGCLECLLKILNFIFTLIGLAMVGYGIYLLVEYKKATGHTLAVTRAGDDHGQVLFMYLFIGVGVIIFVISCFGCIGAVTRNGCCLSCYSVLVILLILVELGCAAFLFVDKSWQEDIPTDKTGDFDMIYALLKVVRWVALGAVVFEALLFVLALMVRAANRPVDYDSDDELIAPRQQSNPATGVPVAGTLDQRPSRNDAWSTRMREKYGLDTSEFTYNPNESQRYQQTASQPTEERSRLSVM